jgi:uncharacterized phage protein (TIGR01671 family)
MRAGDYQIRFEKDWETINCIVDIESVWQYIWLNDKNGNEIYEGDIVSIQFAGDKCSNCIVERDNPMCRFLFVDMDRNKNYSYSPQQSWIEVIGNIYENPELLGNN